MYKTVQFEIEAFAQILINVQIHGYICTTSINLGRPHFVNQYRRLTIARGLLKSRLLIRRASSFFGSSDFFAGLNHLFFFFGHFVAPAVVADAQIAWHRLSFANANLTAFFEELFDQIFVSGWFDDLFHSAGPLRENGDDNIFLILSDYHSDSQGPKDWDDR
jgi:hypothetical protein